jgi:ubiquinone/menaquinone biosynthesis C-methylase UbiE
MSNRSLSETSQKILKNSPIVEATLAGLLAKERALKVLEVGFGQGRALLELAWRFRRDNVAFYGVDKNQAPPVEKREDLRRIARQHEIMPEAELAAFDLPEIFFYDAARLRFEDDSIDLIYSAVTIRFIERKAEFLEEACRVLKPGGIALLHIGESKWDYPYSLVCDDRLLTPYMTRFVLKHGNELIPLPDYLQLFEEDAFAFRFINRPRCVVQVSKLKSARLRLQLAFNQELSLSMDELPHRHSSGKIRGGIRSVYEVRPEIYRALFGKGLLNRGQLRTDLRISEELQDNTDEEP